MDEYSGQHLSSNTIDRPLNLLDLPLACFTDIVKSLDSTSRLALFATCKTLMDLVLNSADSTSLSLQPLDLNEEQMLTTLELVHHHAHMVAVCLCSEQQLDDQHADEATALMPGWQSQYACQHEHCTQHARQMAQRSCSLLHQAQLMGYLDRVTKLELTVVELAMPLMPLFSDACPNLTVFTLQDSKITWEGVTAESFSAVFPKLQALNLHNVTGQGLTEACQQGLQQQVAQLTELSSVQLTVDNGGIWEPCVPLYGDIAAALAPKAVSQLTHAALSCSFPTSQWACDQLGNLRTLQMQEWFVKDEHMQHLLPLPNLTTLQVFSVCIKQSYRGRHCCWQHLIVQRLRWQDFARLPLHSTLQIKNVPKGYVRLLEDTDEDLWSCIPEALDNITTSKWGGWRGAHAHLDFCSSQHLELLLPLCHGMGHLCGLPSKISMVALGNFAAVQQQGFVLDLPYGCSWAVADLAGLVARLPAASTLVVDRASEATIIRLCSAAKRSFALHGNHKLVKHLQPAATKRIKAAVTKGGCTRVVLHDTRVIQIDPSVANDSMEEVSCTWAVIWDSCHGAGDDDAGYNSQSWVVSLQQLHL